MNNLGYPADFWQRLAIALGILLFAQYIYYSIREMMYEESVHQLYRKTEQLDRIRTDILLLEEIISLLDSNDRRLLARIDANKQAIEREIDMVEQRLPVKRAIKRIN